VPTKKDLKTIEPFEICGIRPPSENYSLTFRLTRNCGWNRCLFCPVYKLGARFSRRSIDEVKKDVDRAKRIDDLLGEAEAGSFRSAASSIYDQAAKLVEEINGARGNSIDPPEAEANYGGAVGDRPIVTDDEDDERLKWFASWFKETPTIEDSVYHLLAWRMNGGETCFLGDANSLLLTPQFFREVLDSIKASFPTLNRFTIYGRTRSAAKKSLDELIAFREAGLTRVHFGVESGSDTVLTFMGKGVTAEQQIEGCRKTKQAGISCSVYVMPGLGGMTWSKEHARETARVITESQPDFVRLRTLEIFPKTGLAQAVMNREFVEATEEQTAEEIRTLVTDIECDTVVTSDSASNLLNVNGRLPADREKMLAVINQYLSLSPREKLIFSFQARLSSFLGQYGTVSADILKALYPYLREGRVDISKAQDEEILRITRLIRSKLMP
jgi:radical SAM superfamily enzyme YgiQ (UPF0313 family)